jgi:hypothetical protein
MVSVAAVNSILIGPPFGEAEQTVKSLAESVPLVQFIPLE